MLESVRQDVQWDDYTSQLVESSKGTPSLVYVSEKVRALHPLK